ncbi:hypothetical protein [Natronobeatus ordinarius]|uniref:hypothetical protein n=1 Tax=Natronobeatus ordinarius TaxID=2963433 RepID=UPI0020CEBC75|nr:hypothetical protein [Natronobeatus ordinarius]
MEKHSSYKWAKAVLQYSFFPVLLNLSPLDLFYFALITSISAVWLIFAYRRFIRTSTVSIVKELFLVLCIPILALFEVVGIVSILVIIGSPYLKEYLDTRGGSDWGQSLVQYSTILILFHILGYIIFAPLLFVLGVVRYLFVGMSLAGTLFSLVPPLYIVRYYRKNYCETQIPWRKEKKLMVFVLIISIVNPVVIAHLDTGLNFDEPASVVGLATSVSIIYMPANIVIYLLMFIGGLYLWIGSRRELW